VVKAAVGIKEFYLLTHNPVMHWTEVWFEDDPKSVLIRTVLIPASWLYTIGWNTYLALYRLKLKRPKRPHSPVLCVGNLTVGGSGKTPMTVHIAQVLAGMGNEVVISCSGYGSEASAEATVAPEGPLSAERWGDEAALLRWLLPAVPLVVGRNRVRAAELVTKNYPAAIMLMDDGFQHLPLHKNISILMDWPTVNHHCLPAGPYREPVSHRSRGDLVLPGKFDVDTLPFALIDATERVVINPVKANVLCALGSPEKFLEALRKNGIKLGKIELRPDHAPLREGNLFDGFPANEPLVVTEKDWVKIRERSDLANRKIFVVRHGVRVSPEADFAAWLRQKLNEIKT
jgi:tetraacyldisaccharide 4'-kinase